MISAATVVKLLRDLLAADERLRWGYLFGSCARGGAFRDVDVAVMPKPDVYSSGIEWGQLIARLQQALACPVDLIDLRTAPLPLVGPLLTECIVVLDHQRDARHDWEANVTSRWIDFRPALERYSLVRREAMAARLRGAS